MREHWQSGLADIGRALAHPEWLELPKGENAFVTHDATKKNPTERHVAPAGHQRVTGTAKASRP